MLQHQSWYEKCQQSHCHESYWYFFFFFFFYIPAPFLGHASRNAVATGGEKGKDNVQELCEWNEQLTNLTWWAHRDVRKARGRAGERLHWQDRKRCSQDWQLERPMDNHQDGITSGIFFNLHYTKHGGHNFLSEARFSLQRFTASQNTTSKFETRITQQHQRLYK